MGQINLDEILGFRGFVLRGYTNSRGRYNRQQIALALKRTEASKLFDSSSNFPSHTASCSKTEETETATYTIFLQEVRSEERKNSQILKH
jgi:hypothetical protein